MCVSGSLSLSLALSVVCGVCVRVSVYVCVCVRVCQREQKTDRERRDHVEKSESVGNYCLRRILLFYTGKGRDHVGKSTVCDP